MIHWLWLIPAAIVGAWFGAFVMICLTMGKED